MVRRLREPIEYLVRYIGRTFDICNPQIRDSGWDDCVFYFLWGMYCQRATTWDKVWSQYTSSLQVDPFKYTRTTFAWMNQTFDEEDKHTNWYGWSESTLSRRRKYDTTYHQGWAPPQLTSLSKWSWFTFCFVFVKDAVDVYSLRRE